MPYVRKGKCVYKKSGKKVGCSKTIAKAKAYLRALYHAEGGRKFTRRKKKRSSARDKARGIY